MRHGNDSDWAPHSVFNEQRLGSGELGDMQLSPACAAYGPAGYYCSGFSECVSSQPARRSEMSGYFEPCPVTLP
jgi:hypothetical protein